ncbi:MAG: MMPL family transporter [Alphaproteobacteria bacterium]|nr:MMPL family transporter [Alphaproteobacteria bacterium]
MLTTLIVAIVDWCRRFSWPVLLCAITLTGFGVWYTAHHFKMNTDVNTLLASDLGWRINEKELERAFPQHNDLLLIVIEGRNSGEAESAAARLYEKLQQTPSLYHSIKRPDALPFYRQNGLLLLDTAELTETTNQLMQAQPLLGTLAADPSLRGLFGTLSLVLEGIKRGYGNTPQTAAAVGKMTKVIADVTDGKNVTLDWQGLITGDGGSFNSARRFILMQPVLDYTALSPGAEAGKHVREAARELGLTPDNGIEVKLTGSVALNDEEFASVAEGMGLATIGSLIAVLALLLVALRTLRLVIPIIVTLVCGLALTTATGLFMAGSLNLISVAFAVMFVGIAVDFGIQFGVRFRDQHHIHPDSTTAIQETARIIAKPLLLAGICTAAGFLCFTPTDYAGVAELGLIAGCGMIIALALNLTLLPALITIFRPPAEPETVGFRWTAPIDNFLLTRRKLVLCGAALAALAGAGLTTQLHFDFDPLNLKDPKTESVATLLSLIDDPATNPYTIEILAPDLAAADTLKEKLRALPEVARTMTLSSFIPREQEDKLAIVADANMLLAPTLFPPVIRPPPTNAEISLAINEVRQNLRAISADNFAPGPALLAALDALADRDTPELYERLKAALVNGMLAQIEAIKQLLAANKPVTADDIPQDLREDWVAADGRARIEVHPALAEGVSPRDRQTMIAFTKAVRAIAPEATGTPISIQESGNTIVQAFIQAATGALIAIALLAFLALRRPFDVAALLAPLILAGLLTLGTAVLIGLPINFANIIGLPLLLGLGVSFSIYFLIYWRAGGQQPLQSSMARAVAFSAFTTLVAFGSLSLSSHPGTASMGNILTISLLYSFACTWVLLPALLGRNKLVT